MRKRFLFFLAVVLMLATALAAGNSFNNKHKLDRDDFFIKLESNTSQCLINCEAVFKISNPTKHALPLHKLLKFRFVETKEKALKKYSVLVEVSETKKVKQARYKFIKHTDSNSQGTFTWSEKVFNGFETIEKTGKKWVSLKGFVLKPGETVRVKIKGEKEIGASVDWIPSLDFSKDSSVFSMVSSKLKHSKLEKSEWAWWNSNWVHSREIDFTTTTDLNQSNGLKLVGFNATSLTGAEANLSDARFVWSDSNTLDVNYFDWDGSNTDSDFNVNIYFNNNGGGFSLPAGTYNSGELKVYYDNDSALTNSYQKNYTSVFDSFEDGDFTAKPVWSEGSDGRNGSASVVSSASKEGNKGLRITTDGASGWWSSENFDIDAENALISVWMRVSDVNNCASILTIENGAGNKLGQMSILDNSGTGKFRYRDNSGYTYFGFPEDNEWYKLMFKYDDSETRFDFFVFDSSNNLIYSFKNKTARDNGNAGITSFQLRDSGGGSIDVDFDSVSFNLPEANSGYTVQSESTAEGVFTDFNIIRQVTRYLDPENSVSSVSIDFNSTVTYLGSPVSDKGYEWDFNSTQYSFDQNISRSFSSAMDWNVCLDANATINTVDYSGQECRLFSIEQYPQDVNFSWNPASPGVGQEIDFEATGYDVNGSIDANTWNWGDGSVTETGQDVNHTFLTGGDFNVCLTATDSSDLNKMQCNTVTVYGSLTARIYDENTGAKLQPDTVEIDGTDYSGDVNSDGVLNISLAGFSTGNHTITASDTDYGERQFAFDFNELSVVNANLAMLKYSKGQEIDFKFYDTDQETVLANADVGAMIEDVNYAGNQTTNSLGEATFFLNPQDKNYYFAIETADDRNLLYYQTKVTVKVPKDEDDLTSVSPFDVTVSHMGTVERTGQAADFNVTVLPNTVNYYSFDYNASGYYPRSLQLKVKGNPETVEQQVYLVPTSNGLFTWFYTKNAQTLATLPRVLVRVYKTISGEGTVEVQSKLSDLSGTATLAFIPNDNYKLKFYYQGERVFPDSDVDFFSPAETEYYVYIDLTETKWEEPVSQAVAVQFTPSGGQALHSSPIDLNQSILGLTGLEDIQSIRVTISNKDVNVYDHVFTSGVSDGATLNQSIPLTDLNTSDPLIVTVKVETSLGVFTRTVVYGIAEETVSNWVYALSSPVRGLFGCSADTSKPCLALILMAVFITIGVTGSFTLADFLDYNGVAIAVLMLLGLFTVVGWIPAVAYIVAALGGIGGYIMTRGVR